jgi:hypothetical protein
MSSFEENHPSLGPIRGGTLVTITGRGFVDHAHRCIFDADASETVYKSSTQLTCISPPHVEGRIFLTLDNVRTGGMAKKLFFLYSPPIVLHGINPKSGAVKGGTAVSVLGSSLVASKDFRCKFGDTITANATVMSHIAVVCLSPAHPVGAVPVEVSNNGFDFTDMDYEFMYQDVSIVRIIPSSGPGTGGTLVSVFGSGFFKFGNSACRFGDTTVTAVFISTSELNCATPADLALLNQSASNVAVSVPMDASAAAPSSGTMHGSRRRSSPADQAALDATDSADSGAAVADEVAPDATGGDIR